MKHNTRLTTLQARTLIARIDDYPLYDVMDEDAINYMADTIVTSCILYNPSVYPAENAPLYMAFALSYVAQRAIKEGVITLDAFFKIRVHVARKARIERNDKGAYNDVLEVLIRCALVPFRFIRPSMLHVKALAAFDVESKKYGRIEIGTNGKTWNSGTLDDYMNGDYKAVIYGTYSDMDIEDIFTLIENDRLMDALDYVASYCALWTDKYDFLRDIDGLTRGRGITVKSGKIMSQYNTGKYNAFVTALNDGRFTSLFDLQHND